MGSPFDAGRDDNVGSGNAFDQGDPDIVDSHADVFRASFAPPADELSEEDYRSTEHGGSVPDPTESPVPHQEPPEKPGEFGYPTARPGGFINLP
jgi:hypothetical protein